MPLHFLLTKPDGALLDAPVASQPGDAVVLTGAEAHHAAAVRRVRVGEEVTVGDGRGTWLQRRVRVRLAPRGRRQDPRPRGHPRAASAGRPRAGAREGRPGRARRAGRHRARSRRDRSVAGCAQRVALGLRQGAEGTGAVGSDRARGRASRRTARGFQTSRRSSRPLSSRAGPRHPASFFSSRLPMPPSRPSRSTATIATSCSSSAPRAGSPPRSSRR